MTDSFMKLCVLLAILSQLLSGCSTNDFLTSDTDTDDYMTVLSSEVDDYAEEIAKKTYSLIARRDEAGLMDLFSRFTINNYNVKEEIKTLYSSISGNIIKAEEIEGSFCDGVSSEVNGDVFDSYRAWITNIKTDTGNEYCITIAGTYNYVFQHDKEGINMIFLCSGDSYSYETTIAEVGDVVEYDDEIDDDGETKVMD